MNVSKEANSGLLLAKGLTSRQTELGLILPKSDNDFNTRVKDALTLASPAFWGQM